jgi:hypothetical protein
LCRIDGDKAGTFSNKVTELVKDVASTDDGKIAQEKINSDPAIPAFQVRGADLRELTAQ